MGARPSHSVPHTFSPWLASPLDGRRALAGELAAALRENGKHVLFVCAPVKTAFSRFAVPVTADSPNPEVAAARNVLSAEPNPSATQSEVGDAVKVAEAMTLALLQKYAADGTGLPGVFALPMEANVAHLKHSLRRRYRMSETTVFCIFVEDTEETDGGLDGLTEGERFVGVLPLDNVTLGELSKDRVREDGFVYVIVETEGSLGGS